MPLRTDNPETISASSQFADNEHRLRGMRFISQGDLLDLCWAACGAMVLNYKDATYRNDNLTLARVVAAMQGADCILPGNHIAENKKCDYAREITDVYINYDFIPTLSTKNYNDVALPQKKDLVQIINTDQPVQVHWQYNSGGIGHTDLIVGYRGDGDLSDNYPDLLMYDPLHKMKIIG